MSIYEKDLFGKSKYELAIETLRFHCANKRVLCAFSGGKDSQCCYHLLKDAGIEFTAQYSITRFEPPQLVQFIRQYYPSVVFRRAYKMSLVREIEAKGLPSRWYRWCCECKHCKTVGFDIAVIGVRAAESWKRAKYWRSFGIKPDRTAYVCPILNWSDFEVWEYLDSKSLPHCCMYDNGYKRIGCVLCPMTLKNRDQHILEYPKIVEMLRIGAYRFVDRMKRQGFVTKRGKPCPDWCLSSNPHEEYWRRWLLSCQTVKPLSEITDIEDEMCLFEGTGFSERDGIDVSENEDF